MTSKGNFVAPSYRSKMEWVEIDQVRIHPGCQRAYKPTWANRIAANFDPDLVGKPVVWAEQGRNGKTRYVVLDGQHRFKAAEIVLGKSQKLECEVVRDISLEEAARIFLGRNTSKSVSAIDKFLVGVTAKRAENMAVNDILRSVGIKVSVTPGPGHASAIARIMEIYNQDRSQGKDSLLKRTLLIAKTAWGDHSTSFNGDVMVGLASLLRRHGGDIEESFLLRRLTSHPGGADGVLAKARALRHSLGWSMRNCVASVLVGVYNHGRRKGLLPDWGTEARNGDGTEE